MRIYNRGGLIATIATTDGALTVASYLIHIRGASLKIRLSTLRNLLKD